MLATIDSPIGELTVAARGSKVCLVHFGPVSAYVRSALRAWYPGAPVEPGDDPGGAVACPARYFGGDLASLDEIDVELHGTPFQQRVWNALADGGGRHDDLVRGARRPRRRADGRARRRRRERREPGGGRPPVPPHHRQQRQPDRLRRRSGAEALAAQPRGRTRIAVSSVHGPSDQSDSRYAVARIADSLRGSLWSVSSRHVSSPLRKVRRRSARDPRAGRQRLVVDAPSRVLDLARVDGDDVCEVRAR